MKTKLLLVLSILISISCLGKKEYTLTKADFITQFSQPKAPGRVGCVNEAGQKILLYCNENTQLTLILKDQIKKVLLLHTVKYQDGTIEAIEYSVWAPRKNRSSFKIDDVQSFIIERKFQEYERPYHNLDSLRQAANFKNDSLRKQYTDGTEWVILLKAKTDANKDSLLLLANACYHISFKGSPPLEFAVVQRITADSIYIANSFNTAMAKAGKKEYGISGYPLSDISGLSLLKSGGFAFRSINSSDYNITSQKEDKANLRYLPWYAVNPTNGMIRLFRPWLTDRGFLGITETDGKAVWYEGE